MTAREVTPLATVPAPWEASPITGALEKRIVDSFVDRIADTLGVSGFVHLLRTRASVLTCDVLWCAVTELKPKLYAEIIFGQFPDVANDFPEPLVERMTVLLDWITAQADLLGTLCFVPDFDEFTKSVLLSLNFKSTGIVPAYDTWNGTPYSMEIFFLPRG